jgi:drug/metabolite transporter (DMT)-like permease
LLLFLVSGAIGIGIGDSAYFGALQAIGARRSLLMLVLAPPLTAVLSFLFLEETLPAGAWLGVLTTTAGVAWVISERTASSGLAGSVSLRGIGLGVMAVLGQSVGSVLSHAAFMQSEVGAMSSALWRLTGGTMAVLLLLPFERLQVQAGEKKRSVGHLLPLIGFTVFIGTVRASSVLSLTGRRRGPASQHQPAFLC